MKDKEPRPAKEGADGEVEEVVLGPAAMRPEDAPEIPKFEIVSDEKAKALQEAGRAMRFTKRDYLIMLWNTSMESYANASFVIELYKDKDEHEVVKSVIDNRGGVGVERKIRVKDILPGQIRKLVFNARELVVLHGLIEAEEKAGRQ